MLQVSEMFSARVPRYTSYPTAPHFHAGIDESVYRGWLKELPENLPLSLYVHIPFCDTLCWFCGCHTTAVKSYKPVADYCDLLEKEVRLVAQVLETSRSVSQIHWGGGSPTLLRDGDIARLDSTLRRYFNILPDAEFSIEVDPRGLDGTTVAALKKAGVTRASIGLQDCNGKVQRAINRIQTDAETIKAVGLLRDAGISSLNIDLVYGLPHQTLEDWKATLDFTSRLNPDRLSVFGYAHVPQLKKHQALIPEEALPDTQLRFGQAELARDILCAHGYVAIGLDHFSKPGDALAKAATQGRVKRNFQGYTTDNAGALIGFGASSIGSLPQGYVQNVAAVPAYREAVLANRLPIARGVALDDDDRIRRTIIERLMCDLQADLPAIAAGHARTLGDFADALSQLAPMKLQGIIAEKDGVLTISPNWRSATRLVCAAFDRYLPHGKARHSFSV
jgi:oxygen-independent coproporphyrinogen-3 oxidase